MFRAETNAAGGNHLAADTGILTSPETRWPMPPRGLGLGGNDVHIFCATLDLFPRRMKQLAAMLSEDEKNRASRFRFEHDRNRFIAARGQLREIIGHFLETDPKQITFSYGERGKPHLADAINGKFLHFNLSHSDALALIAVCRDCELGVDIERLRPVEATELVVTPFFSSDELRNWYAMPPSRRAEIYFENWTRTEAFLKFNGEGIGDFPNPIFHCEEECSIQQLHPAAGYTGAIAIKNSDMQIHCWKWDSQFVSNS
jgi:4'-phosphopantetheinyl transferase